MIQSVMSDPITADSVIRNLRAFPPRGGEASASIYLVSVCLLMFWVSVLANLRAFPPRGEEVSGAALLGPARGGRRMTGSRSASTAARSAACERVRENR